MMQAPATPPALPAIFSIEAIAAIAIAALIASAIALLVGSLTRRLLLRIEGERFHTQPIANATVRAVRRVTFVLALIVLLFPALDLAGVELTVGLHPEQLTRWLTESGARILLLILLAFAANRFAGSVIRNAEHEIANGDDPATQERRKRIHTIGSTSRRFFSILIWTAAALMVLRELDLDITPVLAGAGIIGLAVGFGSQTLVKDIISGLFLIAEDQVRLGDVAEINGIGGAVEEISLRTIVLRDLEGTLHYIANGEIRTLANKSKDFSFYVIDIGVGYEDDTDRIIEVVRAVAAELTQEPAYAASILAPLEVLGIDAFKASEVTLRFRIKTLPLRQWDVGRELRRRIKKAFDAQGIQIPGPSMTVRLRRTD
ncbi:MAG TPA: mechanosensitive ion channel family protein [Vicinamibacterales bacterium]|nr:mechanosensitive ion channel family protein [Vicinamibacterales bacterium]